MEYITMNHKEREQLKVFTLIKNGSITQSEGAAKLNCTERWVRKKLKRFLEFGDAGLVHKSRGKQSPRRCDLEKERFVIELLKSTWHGFGPTFAAEKLEELHGIKISREVIRKIMIMAGIWVPKKTRGKHRKRRERKGMFGMMVQVDGSPHDWFEGRAGKCTLLVFIDDATSKILWLEFADAESTHALLQATKNYVDKLGIPQSFYTDFGSVFHVNLNNAEDDKKTQWEQACALLKIKVQHAHSPQAKGRVERCNQTMQDRLIKEMRLAGISSIAAANEYLKTSNFIEKHNAKFAVPAIQVGDAHADIQSYDLNDVFSTKETRILANDFTISFNKRILQLTNRQRTIIRPKNEIVVKTHLDGTIGLWIRQTKLDFKEIETRHVKIVQEKKVKDRPRCKPNLNSRNWVRGLPTLGSSRMKPAAPAVEAIQK